MGRHVHATVCSPLNAGYEASATATRINHYLVTTSTGRRSQARLGGFFELKINIMMNTAR